MNESNIKTKTFTIAVFFLLTAITVYPAVLMNTAKQNILVLGIMAISPITWFICRYITKLDVTLIVMYLCMLAFPMVLHPESIRWSTLIYTGMFISFFISYTKILHCSDFTIQQLEQFIKTIIYSYAIILILQQICFFTGIPIINAINIDITHGFPRLNSIGPEPAWTGRIICILTYLYICIWENNSNTNSIKQFFQSNKWLCLATSYIVLTSGSVTGILFYTILFFKFLNIKSVIPIASFLFLGIFAIENFTTITSIERLLRFIPAVLTLDEKIIINADPSGSSRIIPMIQAFKHVSLTSIEGWFGAGVDYDTQIVNFSGINANGGGFSLWINHGFLVQILFWTIVWKICHIKKDPISIIYCVLIIFGGITINLQVLWFMLILFYTYKYSSKIKLYNI